MGKQQPPSDASSSESSPVKETSDPVVVREEPPRIHLETVTEQEKESEPAENAEKAKLKEDQERIAKEAAEQKEKEAQEKVAEEKKARERKEEEERQRNEKIKEMLRGASDLIDSKIEEQNTAAPVPQPQPAPAEAKVEESHPKLSISPVTVVDVKPVVEKMAEPAASEPTVTYDLEQLPPHIHKELLAAIKAHDLAQVKVIMGHPHIGMLE